MAITGSGSINFDSGTSKFGSTGNALFASQVTTSDRFEANRTTGTDTILLGKLSGSQTTLIQANGAASFNGPMTIGTSATAAGTNLQEWRSAYNSGNIVARIYASGGAVFNGSVTASNISDIRFKENLADAKPQLSDVVALGSQLKNWDWKDDAPLSAELRAKRFLGLVAQEAVKVCPDIAYDVPNTKDGKELTPEVVTPAVYKDEIVPAVVDENGVIIEAETTKKVLVTSEETTPATYEQLDDSYKAINHDILVMKLLGAVAELTAKVEALEKA